MAEKKTSAVPFTLITARQIEIVEDVMNATIRECVMVTELLDSGDIQSAMEALRQIHINAETQMVRIDELVQRAEKKLKKEAARG